MSANGFTPGVEGPPPAPADWLLLARGLDVAVLGEGEEARLPTVADASDHADGLHFLGRLRGTPVFAATVKEGVEVAPPLRMIPARTLYGMVDEAAFGAAGRAIAIAEWDRTHRFCGRCGTPTELVPGERAKKCPRCHTPFYPRIAPAVIVLVEREGEVLLARGVNFPVPRFSTLAGFVEPGESLEEAVRREVMEEVGVVLGELRYFGSQPWPFGRSLMVGFNGRYLAGEVKCDPKEIAEAHWFRPDAMPQIPPRLSIAYELIADWLRRMGKPAP